MRIFPADRHVEPLAEIRGLSVATRPNLDVIHSDPRQSRLYSAFQRAILDLARQEYAQQMAIARILLAIRRAT